VANVTWSPSFKDTGIVLSNGNLTAQNTAGGIEYVQSQITLPATGKYYLEFEVSVTGNPAYQVGIVPSGASLGSLVSTNNGSGYYEGSTNSGLFAVGQTSNGGLATDTGTYVVAMALDLTDALMWAGQVAGTWIGVNGAGGTPNPATGAYGMPLSGMAAGPYYLAFSTNENGAICALNLAGPFTLTKPSGYSALNTAGSGSGMFFGA
jgi:hypothetical protein